MQQVFEKPLTELVACALGATSRITALPRFERRSTALFLSCIIRSLGTPFHRDDRTNVFCVLLFLCGDYYSCTYNHMKIVWDEPKRAANLFKHGMDFASLTIEFFETSTVIPAKKWQASSYWSPRRRNNRCYLRDPRHRSALRYLNAPCPKR